MSFPSLGLSFLLSHGMWLLKKISNKCNAGAFSTLIQTQLGIYEALHRKWESGDPGASVCAVMLALWSRQKMYLGFGIGYWFVGIK